MEDLAPTLRLALHLRAALENGESVRQSLQAFCREQKISSPDLHSLRRDLQLLLTRFEAGVDKQKFLPEKCSGPRRALLQLIVSALRGLPIHSHLIDIQTEVLENCEAEIETFVTLLPLKLLAPLLLLFFPGFALLFLGPFLETLFASI